MDEEKKKISFIINPKSGTQSKEQILHLLDEKLDKAKYVQEVIYTEYAGHAVEIAAQKAKEKWYKYFMNTYAQTPIVIDSGQGSTVVDLDGKNILILQVDMEHYP